MATKNILLVGVGGQGTILISKILSAGFAEKGYDVKMSEIHGMSQRGGSVTTQIKYGDKVYAPNMGDGDADMIISFEKIEAARALPYLKKGGKLITDEREIYPMSVLTGAAPYPHDTIEAIKAAGVDVTVVKAAEIAEKLGNIKAQNIMKEAEQYKQEILEIKRDLSMKLEGYLRTLEEVEVPETPEVTPPAEVVAPDLRGKEIRIPETASDEPIELIFEEPTLF